MPAPGARRGRRPAAGPRKPPAREGRVHRRHDEAHARRRRRGRRSARAAAPRVCAYPSERPGIAERDHDARRLGGDPRRGDQQRRQPRRPRATPAHEQREPGVLPRRLPERAGEEHQHADGDRLLVVVDDRVRHPRADRVGRDDAEPDARARARAAPCSPRPRRGRARAPPTRAATIRPEETRARRGRPKASSVRARRRDASGPCCITSRRGRQASRDVCHGAPSRLIVEARCLRIPRSPAGSRAPPRLARVFREPIDVMPVAAIFAVTLAQLAIFAAIDDPVGSRSRCCCSFPSS